MVANDANCCSGGGYTNEDASVASTEFKADNGGPTEMCQRCSGYLYELSKWRDALDDHKKLFDNKQ